MHGPEGTRGAELATEATAMMPISRPVASQAPLAIAQERNSTRRTGFISDDRIASATISAIMGIKIVSSPAATFDPVS
jgi:hypothetical protein